MSEYIFFISWPCWLKGGGEGRAMFEDQLNCKSNCLPNTCFRFTLYFWSFGCLSKYSIWVIGVFMMQTSPLHHHHLPLPKITVQSFAENIIKCSQVFIHEMWFLVIRLFRAPCSAREDAPVIYPQRGSRQPVSQDAATTPPSPKAALGSLHCGHAAHETGPAVRQHQLQVWRPAKSHARGGPPEVRFNLAATWTLSACRRSVPGLY